MLLETDSESQFSGYPYLRITAEGCKGSSGIKTYSPWKAFYRKHRMPCLSDHQSGFTPVELHISVSETESVNISLACSKKFSLDNS